MTCRRCGRDAPPIDDRCPSCGTLVDEAPDSLTSTGVGASSPPEPSVDTARIGPRRSWPQVGHQFGSRYDIIQSLGAGGMGAVFQAWDKIAEVEVALKVIRTPDSADPEAARSLERRLKRELVLARQVTHKHVVRIHDLGEVDGTTYLTMPYVRGANLAQILRKEGRLPVDRTVDIVRQVASGLGAAHEAGVVHRDLKPANIMIQADGSALVMDFGIARSTSDVTRVELTAGDAIVGTIEYMAPEQARAGGVDHRADIYALGLIARDLLVGRRGRDSGGVTELIARIQQAPAPMRSIDPSVPSWLDAIVSRCLQLDPSARYQTIAEFLADLDRLGTGVVSAQTPVPAAERARWKWPVRQIAIASVILSVATIAFATRHRWWPTTSGATTPDAPIPMAILPFRNVSGDTTLDSLGVSVTQILGSEFGQSARVRAVPIDRLVQVLRDLRVSTTAAIPPAELERVADFTSARRLVLGQYTRFAEAIRIDVELRDLDRQTSVPITATAPNEAGVLAAISSLADGLRTQLGRESRGLGDELKATAWKPSTSSFEALRLYSEGLDLGRQGSHQEARQRFEAAVQRDPAFALGYSALARESSALGYDFQATEQSNKAMAAAQQLPAPERLQVEVTHYRLANNPAKAIEAYENLAKGSPNDPITLFELGGLYEQRGDYNKAREYFARVVALDPKYAEGLLALGRIEVRRGDYESALTPLTSALPIAIQLNRDESRANILQAIGIAYKRLDKPEEALRHYQQSLEIKRRLGNRRGVAASLGEIAQIQDRLGNPAASEATIREAIAIQREINDRAGLSVSLVNLGSLLNEALGRPDDAMPLLQEALRLRRDAGNKIDEALVLNNIGTICLAKGELLDAQTNFERSLELRERHQAASGDIADTLHNLGETMAWQGRYDQALSRFHRALELRRQGGNKRFEAIESFSIASVFDSQSRYGAAAKSKSEAVQMYRDGTAPDAWLVEMVGGLGRSLALAGRFTDAQAQLTEGMTLARSLKIPDPIAKLLVAQAELTFDLGDLKAAASFADQAVAAASKTPNRALSLAAEIMQARVATALGPNRTIAARLGKLSSDAERRGLRPIAVEASIARATALVALGDRATARVEIDRALTQAEQLGLKVLSARGHYLRAQLLQAAKDPAASREFNQVLSTLTAIRDEEGNASLFKRAELNMIRAASERAVGGS